LDCLGRNRDNLARGQKNEGGGEVLEVRTKMSTLVKSHTQEKSKGCLGGKKDEICRSREEGNPRKNTKAEKTATTKLEGRGPN